MDTESIPLGLRFLIALSAMIATVYISDYFRRPEDCFIKRLRPNEGIQYTHVQLLFRAYIGVGLISVTPFILGLSVVVYEEASVELRRSAIAIGLVLGFFLGVCSYLYFRIWRYVETAPSERSASVSGGQRVFVRRIAPDPNTWGLRLTLIILAAIAAVAGPTILIVLFIFTSNLLS